jgi:hypothetical protein
LGKATKNFEGNRLKAQWREEAEENQESAKGGLEKKKLKKFLQREAK